MEYQTILGDLLLDLPESHTSHLLPLQSGGHLHEKSPPSFPVQLPPFAHGFESQGSKITHGLSQKYV